MQLRKVAAAALGLAVAMGVAGCGSDDESGGGAGNGTGGAGKGGTPIAVVASTDVWGDVVAQVGGDAVAVTSIISDPDQDPHSYEASATTALAISKAALVVENGGGYDDFVDRMLDANGATAKVINAVDVSGKTAPEGGELNEHVWYDFPTVEKVADQVAAELGELDPDRASTFRDNAAAFKTKVDALVDQAASLKAEHDGEGVGITEPVPLYLTEAAGLVDKTPEEFSEAIEEGDDVAPAVLQETLDLYAEHAVQVLVYNEQTSGPITEQVKKAAEAAGVPVVPVTETLPDGLDYVDWMQGNLDALSAALG
jgi:zinc/manganese transport system substrate-binding protein